MFLSVKYEDKLRVKMCNKKTFDVFLRVDSRTVERCKHVCHHKIIKRTEKGLSYRAILVSRCI